LDDFAAGLTVLLFPDVKFVEMVVEIVQVVEKRGSRLRSRRQTVNLTDWQMWRGSSRLLQRGGLVSDKVWTAGKADCFRHRRSAQQMRSAGCGGKAACIYASTCCLYRATSGNIGRLFRGWQAGSCGEVDVCVVEARGIRFNTDNNGAD